MFTQIIVNTKRETDSILNLTCYFMKLLFFFEKQLKFFFLQLSHRPQAESVHALRQRFSSRLQSDHTHAHAYRREAL